MRLLHTKELRFQEFFDDNIPQYAILSHTWGTDEISYQDLLAIQNNKQDTALVQSTRARSQKSRLKSIYRASAKTRRQPRCREKDPPWIERKKSSQGYQKILAFCKFAADDAPQLVFEDVGASFSLQVHAPMLSFDWVWIDTCCIDKSSSAELSEAINSMHRWYKGAAVCYAYLADVSGKAGFSSKLRDRNKIRWFTRGWTLQELLAPQDVVFLDKAWGVIGSRYETERYVSRWSQIPVVYLQGRSTPLAAVLFSWAANRTTSRREDEAYCLFGLFGINLPLLYGEGANALRRLQLEIIRTSNDESVFAWDLTYRPQQKEEHHAGLLATSLEDFASDRGMVNFEQMDDIERPPYNITNQGIELHVPMDLADKNRFLLPLPLAHLEGSRPVGAYAILLVHQYKSQWVRASPSSWLDHMSEFDGGGRRLHATSGLFIVPSTWVWSRNDLQERGSVVIYARL